MSQLLLQTNTFGQFALNVTSFNSSIFGTMNSSQTKTKQQVFPIKANQLEIEFNVQFASEQDYENFQAFVRRTQVDALTNAGPQVHLWWPERNINNWSGLIKAFQAGGMRGNYSPHAKFTVYLIDSLVSELTDVSSYSIAPSIQWGVTLNVVDLALTPPSNIPQPTTPPVLTPPAGG